MGTVTERDGVRVLEESEAGAGGAEAAERLERRRSTARAWAMHELEKRFVGLSEDAKEEQADQLLSENGEGEHCTRSRRTISRRRAREIPLSQLEAPSYSGSRQLLRSMGESMRLIDAEEHSALDDWFVRWEVVHAIRAEGALSGPEKEALLGRIEGETLRETAERLGVSYEQVRKLLSAALGKYYAGRLRRLEVASAAAVCFQEDVARPSYRPPNCCGQSPLCMDGAEEKPCARYEHEEVEEDGSAQPGDLNYCPLAEVPRWLWSRR